MVSGPRFKANPWKYLTRKLRSEPEPIFRTRRKSKPNLLCACLSASVKTDPFKLRGKTLGWPLKSLDTVPDTLMVTTPFPVGGPVSSKTNPRFPSVKLHPPDRTTWNIYPWVTRGITPQNGNSNPWAIWVTTGHSFLR